MTNTLLNSIKEQLNETRTTNGDVAYKSTFNANLDFFALASGLSKFDREKGVRLFEDAFYENEALALKNLLYVRDIYNGSGRREPFISILEWLANNHPNHFYLVARNIKDLGCWRDLTLLVPKVKTEKSLDLLKVIVFTQLVSDVDALTNNELNKISLLAKWMPSLQTKSQKQAALVWVKMLAMKPAQYRKMLSALRKALNIVETKVSMENFEEIDYGKIPAKALLRYTRLFKEKDGERWHDFVESMKKDVAKLTAKADKLFPHEIIASLSKDKDLANSMWESLSRDSIKGNAIVVRDGSGSMYTSVGGNTSALDVATALSLFTAESLTGPFANKFITFSESPQLVEIPESRKTLQEKIDFIGRYNEVANTNIEKVYDLLLEASKNANKEDYIDTVLILSDMQFDSCVVVNDLPYSDYFLSAEQINHNNNKLKSVHDTYKQKFEEAGVPFPKVIFWNLCNSVGFPTTDLDNVYLVSGFSKNILADVMQSNVPDALTYMLSVLARYDELLLKA